MIDMKNEDWEKELDFACWSTGGASDYRNDRNRPYNGKPHTDQGERGKTEVRGLTMRDIADCVVQGFLAASIDVGLSDKTVEINKDMMGTKYEKKNTWRYQDVYQIKTDIDPIAVIQTAMCFVEHMMGIFPNVSKAASEEIRKELFEEPE